MKSPRTKRPGRRRSILGAALASLGVLATAACGASAWWWVGYVAPTWLADFGDGTLYTSKLTNSRYATRAIGWEVARNTDRNTDRNTGRAWTWTWWTWGEPINKWSDTAGYSVWPVAPALLLVGSAFLLAGAKARRRARRDQCLKCGYSLAGLSADAACPECGQNR